MQPGIIGYCDPWSARPGDTISFKISSAGGRPFTSRVVRVRHADPNPAGPGLKLLPVPGMPDGRHDGIEQAAVPGSYGHAPCPQLPDGAFHLGFNARVLRHFARPQALMVVQDSGGRNHLGLGLLEGTLVVLAAADGAACVLPTGLAVEISAWWSVGVTFDAAAGTARIECVDLGARRPPVRRGSCTITLPEGALPASSRLTRSGFGALLGPVPVHHLDGQLEAPRIGAGPLPDLAASRGTLGIGPDRTLAAWDFAADMMSQTFADRGPDALHGTFVNLPTRAMTGSNWSGREMAWRHAPGEYGVVHVHSDDVGDLGWTESLSLTIPDDLASGVYALQSRATAAWTRSPSTCCLIPGGGAAPGSSTWPRR